MSGTAPTLPTSLESADQLQARFLARETPKSLLIGIASAWLLAAGMWGGQPTAAYGLRCLGWSGIISMLLLRGCLIARQLRSTDADQTTHHLDRLRRNAVLLACLWGLSAVVLLPGSNLEHQLLLVAAIALITMGGAIGRAVHDRQVPWFVMLTTLLFALGLLLQPGRFQFFIGLGYLLFGSVVALFTGAQDNMLRRERELGMQLQQARLAAERASAAKTRFLAAASHDLRQPMHAIGLLVGLMLQRTAGQAELAALASKAQQSVTLMEELFGSLLDISKLDAGAVHAEPGPLPLQRLLDQIDQTWAPQAAAKGLQLRVRTCSGWATSDAALLARIVHNLVANAVTYTRRGGVLVACRRRAGGWALQVWDTGPGIAPAQQSTIFDEFVRLAEPGAGNRGLGLGLAIVQRSAQVLGHAVRLASRPGHGSCFSVWLPVAAPAPSAVAPPLEEAGQASPLRGAFVALVDADPAGREAMTAWLGDQGCLVVSAADGPALLTGLQQHLRSPDLLLADCHGPTGPGGPWQRLLQQLRAEHGDALPALLLDAALPAGAAEALTWCDGPGQRLLHKPVTPGRLKRTAEALLLSAANATPRTAAPAAAAAPPVPTDPAGAASPSLP